MSLPFEIGIEIVDDMQRSKDTTARRNARIMPLFRKKVSFLNYRNYQEKFAESRLKKK
jgi:hypothetical protein